MTYELMEFLATQQIKVSQRMAEEHAEQQMIECALTRTTESEDDGPLAIKHGPRRGTTERRHTANGNRTTSIKHNSRQSTQAVS